MKKIELAALMFLLGIMLASVFYVKSCKKKQATVIRQIDSNIVFDHSNDKLEQAYFFAKEENEALKHRLSDAERQYKGKEYIYVKGDTQIKYDTMFFDCCEQIEFANQIILKQDTTNQLNEKMLDACRSQVLNLRKQVEYNRDTLFCPDYKHLVWRMYWKRK